MISRLTCHCDFGKERGNIHQVHGMPKAGSLTSSVAETKTPTAEVGVIERILFALSRLAKFRTVGMGRGGVRP